MSSDLEGNRRISYIWSQSLQDVADCLPSNIGRSSVVHGLIDSLALLDHSSSVKKTGEKSVGADRKVLNEDDEDKVEVAKVTSRARVIPPDMDLGSEQVLKRYHEKDYVASLLRRRKASLSVDRQDDSHSDQSPSSSDGYSDDDRPSKRQRIETHGFEHDCPPFPELAEYARTITAGTLTACRELVTGSADIAIHWDGGRHHALRNRASGFCYVADIVLGIMLLVKEGKVGDSTSLLEPPVTKPTSETSPLRPDSSEGIPRPIRPKVRLPRIMYFDLDIHYGDGVAQAFHSPSHFLLPLAPRKRHPRPPQVLTLSVHHTSKTFFPPASSHIDLPSSNTPHPFTLSIPLAAYPSSKTYAKIWEDCVEPIRKAFDPDYVVLQLGMDGLPGDPIGQCGAWSIDGEGGMRWCVEDVKGWGRPLCVLGGGGYRSDNVARAWATATAVLLGRDLPVDTPVPDHAHFPLYGPSFDMSFPDSTIPDENTEAHLQEVAQVYAVLADRIKTIIQANT